MIRTVLLSTESDLVQQTSVECEMINIYNYTLPASRGRLATRIRTNFPDLVELIHDSNTYVRPMAD